MSTSRQITKIAITDNEANFKWKLNEIRRYNEYYESNKFSLSDTCWTLGIHPISHKSKAYTLFLLKRLDKGNIKYITFEITVKAGTSSDVLICSLSRYFDQFDAVHTSYFEKIYFLEGIIVNTIVTCYIKLHPEKTKSSATQTNGEWSSVNLEGFALLKHHLKDMFTMGTDHDVTISMKNMEFFAHRNILSARSPVFAMMLTHDTKEKNTGTICIEDCDPDSFYEFLLYVYTGRTENMTPGIAVQLYYTADKYYFPVLKKQCVSFLKSSLSITSICDVILLAIKHEEKDLQELAMQYFAQNIMEILETAGWLSFMTQNPVVANELYIKSMKILHPKK